VNDRVARQGHAGGDGQRRDSRAAGNAARRDTRRRQASSRLRLVLLLAFVYMLAEAAGGLVTNSLALLADAGHMLSDVAALAISLAGLRAARRAPTASHTYGYHRAEVLGALVNAVALVVVATLIFLEAFRRFGAPPEVAAPTALVIATGGLAVNVTALVLLGGDEHDSIGVRGAWLHVLGDALGSVGAMVSAGVIWMADWRWADPAASLLIAALVVYSGLSLLWEVIGVLMEGAPPHIDVDEVHASIVEMASVDGVHDLHVWTITSGMESLSGHVVVASQADHQKVLGAVRGMLEERFDITHVTLQIETEDFEEGAVCR